MELEPIVRLHVFTFAGYSPGKKTVLTVLLKYASLSLAFLTLSHLCILFPLQRLGYFYLLKYVKEPSQKHD